MTAMVMGGLEGLSGAALVDGGTGGLAASGALAMTGVGAPLGGTGAAVSSGAIVVGTGMTIHGTATSLRAASNMAADEGRVYAKKNTNLTPEKQQNLQKADEKGIPRSQLGPSGKPKVHTVSKSNNKAAKDAARNNLKSNSKPVKHSNDTGQKTHYHSTKDGSKLGGKDNVHYEDRSTRKNQ